MVIGIVGSRRRNSNKDFIKVKEALVSVYRRGDTLVSGGCPKGADRFAEIIACTASIPIQVHYPDRNKLDPKLPKRVAFAKINYDRNTLIAQDADILIACVASDRKGGTEDTIKKFLKRKTRSSLILC